MPEGGARAGGLLLAGDIGGTSTRLGLFEVAAGALRSVARQHYTSHGHAGLEAILADFRKTHAAPLAGACFGVAGPVVAGHVETPNLAWDVDAASVARALGLPAVGLINDLEANAHGVFALGPGDLVTLNAGAPNARGNIAVIAAGTGLGEAGMYWDGARHHPFAAEGGHCDFSPRDELGIDLLRYLAQKLASHVSWERVVSGPGLVNVYEFLRDTGRGAESPALTAQLAAGDPAAAISQAALAGTSDLCVQAVDLFVACYGAEAGNLALKMLATGGVYLGGGIAPKIIDALKRPTFMRAFADKGRLQPLLAAMPVRVIMNDETALLGAARRAAMRAALLDPDAR